MKITISYNPKIPPRFPFSSVNEQNPHISSFYFHKVEIHCVHLKRHKYTVFNSRCIASICGCMRMNLWTFHDSIDGIHT